MTQLVGRDADCHYWRNIRSEDLKAAPKKSYTLSRADSLGRLGDYSDWLLCGHRLRIIASKTSSPTSMARMASDTADRRMHKLQGPHLDSAFVFQVTGKHKIPKCGQDSDNGEDLILHKHWSGADSNNIYFRGDDEATYYSENVSDYDESESTSSALLYPVEEAESLDEIDREPYYRIQQTEENTERLDKLDWKGAQTPSTAFVDPKTYVPNHMLGIHYLRLLENKGIFSPPRCCEPERNSAHDNDPYNVATQICQSSTNHADPSHEEEQRATNLESQRNQHSLVKQSCHSLPKLENVASSLAESSADTDGSVTIVAYPHQDSAGLAKADAEDTFLTTKISTQPGSTALTSTRPGTAVQSPRARHGEFLRFKKKARASNKMALLRATRRLLRKYQREERRISTLKKSCIELSKLVQRVCFDA